MHLIVLALAFLLSLNVFALPLQTDHNQSPTSLSVGLTGMSDALRHGVPDNSAAHARANLAVKPHNISLLEQQLQKRQPIFAAIARVGQVIAKGLGKLISKIVEKVKAKRREKKLKAVFTKSVVQEGRRARPQFNWVICNTKHRVEFKGQKGVDWDHEQKDFQLDGKTVKYDVYFGKEGEFWNQGHKGPTDWAYEGSYEVDRKSKGKHLIFKRP